MKTTVTRSVEYGLGCFVPSFLKSFTLLAPKNDITKANKTLRLLVHDKFD